MAVMLANHRSRIRSIGRKLAPVLRRHGAVRAGIFGSVSTGRAKKSSDVDVLVRFRGRKSLLGVVRAERELGERIGGKVDIVEYSAVYPRLKKRILKEEVRIL